MTLKTVTRDPDLRAARSIYYQEIARRFFYHRGAPFSLSSQDVALIAQWEEMRIPVNVVLEGIDKAFETKPRKPGGGKVRTLAFCAGQVEKFFRQVRDGAVGRPVKSVKEPSAERNDAIEALNKFLRSLPAEIEPLRPVYARALEMLRAGNAADDDWERLEEDAECAIVTAASDADLDEVKKRAAAEFKTASRPEFKRILRVKTIKFLRDKYKIPHLSPYYY